MHGKAYATTDQNYGSFILVNKQKRTYVVMIFNLDFFLPE